MILPLILAYASVLAHPSGSPICQIKPGRIAHGMGSSSHLGLKLKSTRRSSNDVELSILGPPTHKLSGILLYVAKKSAPRVHIGNFKSFDKQKFTLMPARQCAAERTTGSTLTHKNSNPVSLKDAKFVWSGRLERGTTVYAVVTDSRSKWEILELDF
jgi:hypothetical protein